MRRWYRWRTSRSTRREEGSSLVRRAREGGRRRLRTHQLILLVLLLHLDLPTRPPLPDRRQPIPNPQPRPRRRAKVALAGPRRRRVSRARVRGREVGVRRRRSRLKWQRVRRVEECAEGGDWRESAVGQLSYAHVAVQEDIANPMPVRLGCVRTTERHRRGTEAASSSRRSVVHRAPRDALPAVRTGAVLSSMRVVRRGIVARSSVLRTPVPARRARAASAPTRSAPWDPNAVRGALHRRRKLERREVDRRRRARVDDGASARRSGGGEGESLERAKDGRAGGSKVVRERLLQLSNRVALS